MHSEFSCVGSRSRIHAEPHSGLRRNFRGRATKNLMPYPRNPLCPYGIAYGIAYRRVLWIDRYELFKSILCTPLCGVEAKGWEGIDCSVRLQVDELKSTDQI